MPIKASPQEQPGGGYYVKGASHSWGTDDGGIWTRYALSSGQLARVAFGGTSPRVYRASGRVTASEVWANYGDYIRWGSRWVNAEDDHDEHMLVATICCESMGDPDPYPRRPDDLSYGLCQFLPTTAHFVGSLFGWRDHGMPSLVDPHSEWREFLKKPLNSIMLAAGYYYLQRTQFGVLNDPLALYASFNAGGLYMPRSPKYTNPFGLHATNLALEAFRNFYNDSIKTKATT